MAKNTSNTSYRKLDVDAFDPEKYDENEDMVTVSPLAVGPDDKLVQQLLTSGKNAEALKAALCNPPLNVKNMDGILEKAVATVVKTLTNHRNAEIRDSIKELNDDEVDILMKYIYKGMEIMPDGSVCNSLLSWHSHAFERCGHGGIMRVFSDRTRL
uniref:Actin-related protein 2/3 complex subunit 5 n=1 Tax=Strongyloides venezuelensis TaxID=75913 RepID=A0A0K0FR36_STRVS